MTKHTTKISKLQVKKVLGLKLAEAFRRLGELDRAIRVEQCGTYLEFSQVQDGESMLTAANFCRESLLVPGGGLFASSRTQAGSLIVWKK